MSISEEYTLKWNDFQQSLSSSFHSLLKENILLDVTLGADGHFIQAHKLILAACSTYFKQLFQVNPCKHPIVILKDVEVKELTALLEFIYKGEVNVAQEDLGAFLKTAEMLKITGLTQSSRKAAFMTTNINEKSLPFERSSLKSSSRISDRISDPVDSPSEKRLCIDQGTCQDSNEQFIDAESSELKHEPEPIEIIDEDSNQLHIDLSPQETRAINEEAMESVIDIKGTRSSTTTAFSRSFDLAQDTGQGDIRFVYSQRGRPQLVHNGYIYKLQENRTANAVWLCTFYDKHRCKVRCREINGKLVFSNLPHIHPQQHDEIKLKESNPSLLNYY